VPRSVADFLERFVLPLVRGGEMAVGRPVSVDDLQRFEDELAHASEALVAVDEARTDVVAELVVRPPALVLDADELHLAAAVHNLLFLAHPRTESWTVSARAERKVLETARQFAARPLTQNRIRALSRHALLHNLFDLSRTDVRLTWWTGSATYHGQRPPTRLTAWKGLRRVRQESAVVRFQELLGAPRVQPVVTALLRRSPVTHLLSVAREGPPLHWEDAVWLLRDPELCRAIAYNAVDDAGASGRSGADAGQHAARVAAPARFAAAFEQMLERAPAEADVRAVAAFLLYLNVLLAMAEVTERDPSEQSALLATVLAPERAGQRPRGLASFFALPSALERVDPRMARPPGLTDDPALERCWQNHRAQVADGVGEAVIETLAGRIGRHLTGVLESGQAQHGESADR
jgi:hypothetical protein